MHRKTIIIIFNRSYQKNGARSSLNKMTIFLGIFNNQKNLKSAEKFDFNLFVYFLTNESSGEQTSSKRSSRRYKKRNNPISIRRGPLFDRSGAKATPCCFSLELTSVVDSFSNSATLQQQSTIKIYFSFV